jgi:5-methyltetrahydrofolate--homocysteine methyltransferase
MLFEETLRPERERVCTALGMPAGGELPNWPALRERVAEASRPRWVWRRLPLAGGEPGAPLAAGALTLPGRDIAEHLAGCEACVLLAVTLGAAVDRMISAAESANMGQAVILDAAASVLAERYADEAGRQLAAQANTERRYLTGRFSPGYGDLPLALQAGLLGALNAQRSIGLTVSATGILLPRKSITAVVGQAACPVSGRPAGCGHCALSGKCGYKREGRHCGGF